MRSNEQKIKDDKIDLKALPEHVKRELIDYYAFLIKKYGINPKFKKHGSQKKAQPYLKARKILKKCNVSLSKDIINDREDRI